MINSLGFIAHPIDAEHIYKMVGPFGNVFKRMAPFHLKELLKHVPPYKLNTVRNIRSSLGALIDCHTIVCPLLPEDMVSLKQNFVINRVVQAVRRAARNGAKIVTLGGFTSIVGNEGEEVAKHVDIAVTSGNTYTAALAIEGIIRAAYYMDISLESSTLAVIGATGDIGSICTKILANKVKKVNIVARDEAKLSGFAEALKDQTTADICVYKYTKDAVKDADIILTVTSAISAIITPEILKPGSIVCDVAIPANIAKEVSRLRKDIFVFEGGLAKLPYQSEIKDRLFNELMPTGSIYGCLAEGMVLTLEGKFENYSLGRGLITENKVSEILKMAKKHGIQLADFFCGYRFYSDDDIQTIKRNAKRSVLGGEFSKK